MSKQSACFVPASVLVLPAAAAAIGCNMIQQSAYFTTCCASQTSNFWYFLLLLSDAIWMELTSHACTPAMSML
jgi:hypothetical protein